MIVFISDLHFVDETAGKHNIPSSAFELFLNEIKAHVKSVQDKAFHVKDNKLKIVFLGDIFDLLRTEAWFGESEHDRPWGRITSQMWKRANLIMEDTANKNRATFALFSPDSLRNRFNDTGIEVETIYIPGNHDRLCRLDDNLKNKVIQLLGLSAGNDQNFRYHFIDTDHGAYALHGHPFDKFNYEGGPNLTDKDYELVPIGDPITTELVSKLPYCLMQNVKKRCNLSQDELDHLERNFQEIENVRPLSATLKWLLYQVAANRHLKDVIEDTVDQLVVEFEKLEYVKHWYSRHDKWTNPFDTADQIQGALFFLKQFKLFSTSRLLAIADKLDNLFDEDELAKGAAGIFPKLDSRIQYIVMGHTHTPLKKAVSTGTINGRVYEHMYLNTGTWRKRYHECRDRSGFIGWKDMTYLIFYAPSEKYKEYGMSTLPVFESWSGSLKREE